MVDSRRTGERGRTAATRVAALTPHPAWFWIWLSEVTEGRHGDNPTSHAPSCRGRRTARRRSCPCIFWNCSSVATRLDRWLPCVGAARRARFFFGSSGRCGTGRWSGIFERGLAAGERSTAATARRRERLSRYLFERCWLTLTPVFRLVAS